MAWRCQLEPYLTKLQASVTRCSAGSFSVKNVKKTGFNVQLTETVFFPEGGGQPGDSGQIFWGNESANVLYTFREGSEAVHLCDKEIPEGTEVELEIDWKRRFDNMQQHTGQHLISAIFERPQFDATTTSWNLGDDISYVELSRPVTKEEIATVEDICNLAIRQRTSVTIEIFKTKAELREGCKDLPDDFAGPIRVVNIDSVDQNMCCGTHVDNLADVQAIKLLHAEKGKKGKGILWFVCGDRVFKTLGKSWDVLRSSCQQLSCLDEQLSDRIQKLNLSNRQAVKDSKNLTKELAGLVAEKIVANPPEDRLIKIHRADVGPDFLMTCADQMKSLVQDGKVIFLTCGQQNAGNVLILGPKEVVDALGPEVLKKLDGKGASKNGRVQGKVSKLKNLTEAYQLFDSV